ncbi:MAG TPA: hypothetical protein VMD27_07065 [Candidatus Aquilonibacter sp.]|nr:hypothetical protein [Candidatus Aquilonibacter sp.]
MYVAIEILAIPHPEFILTVTVQGGLARINSAFHLAPIFDLCFIYAMPKPAQDLRLHGVKFEDALKRIISAPPPPEKRLKKALKKGGKNPARN